MKQLKLYALPFFISALFILFAIASAPSKMTFHNSDKWIPAEFNPNAQILLIENFHSSSVQQKAEDYVSKHYPYKYEFVSKEDIYSTDKYKDNILYRFALISNKDYFTTNYTRSNGSTGSISGEGTDFGFYDRKLGVTLQKAKRGSSNALLTFKPIINSIVKQYQQ